MYTPNDDAHIYLFCRLILVVEMLEHFEVPKVVKPTNKETFYYKIFGTSVINSPMSLPSMKVCPCPTPAKNREE